MQPDDENTARPVYLRVDAGTIETLATQLHDELSGAGYSLLIDDVINIALMEAQYYSAWAVLEAQRNATMIIPFDKNITLEAYEWAVIDPVLRAHCDLVQSRLVEGSRSLGGDGFGLSVSEANQIYLEARKTMQLEAFVEPPFSYKTMSE
ncbi:hypothetical protein [Acinetobacter puyangensis]|uniref:hypothetical protein n=1 Tax=Acinetobacter puyangensis TaxID=1096779 RepID=UPI001D17B596|nr:hypothetical protein [Acinetobacter puyangensis]